MIDEMNRSGQDAATIGQYAADGDVIAIVTKLVSELHPQRGRYLEVLPSSRIERDLGIDSLSRIELILRLERAFRVRLSARVAGEAETVHDLMRALNRIEAAREGATHAVSTAPILPSVPAASEAQTLLAVLEWHVSRHPSRLHLTVLQDEAAIQETLTFGALSSRARNIALGLIERNIAPGDRVALMLPTSIEFFVAFYGVLYAGAVPVPIYPPMRMSQLEDHLRRQAGILRNAQASLLITLPEASQLAKLIRAQVETLRLVESVANLETPVVTGPLPEFDDPASIALIQYTSGSTGDPKGVVLTHANLLANIRAMGTVMGANSSDVFVSWLPLYHDMGLIGAWLGCLHFAAPLYVMSPLSFLVRPESWLWALHRYRATLSASPNFGFEFCLDKIADRDLEGLDLSALRMVMNGAEPVSAQTLRRFCDRFADHGFSARAMAPVYGLAESSVGLAFPPPGRLPIVDRVDRDRLSIHTSAEPAKPTDTMPLEIVACGQPLPGHELRIVDDAGLELGERREGRIEFRGPSTTCGYFRNEVKTQALIHNGWLDSGDRGYLAEGDIYITGRIKDIIIRAGRHLYPQELEAAVAEIPGMRKGGVAVFGVADRATGTERIVVLAETRESDPAARQALQERTHQVVTDIAGTPPDEVVLAPPRTVPKTSSGKIRRSAAKQLYESGNIGLGQRALWRQVMRLSLASIGPQVRRSARLTGDILYAAWWWLVLAIALALGAVAVAIVPRLSWRWSVLHRLARGMLAAVGVRVTASGLDRIPQDGAVVLFNHSSYVDALILAAVLPGEPAVVAKRELARRIIVGPLLRRLGVPFVERYDVSEGVADAEMLIEVAHQGRVLVFFPEGTFTRRPGLSAFYLGAFKVAAEANLAVFPGVIRGTRSMLRADQWLPRHTSIAVEIGAAAAPSGKDFHALLRLRDTTRAAMLTLCGEPDLGELMKPAPLA